MSELNLTLNTSFASPHPPTVAMPPPSFANGACALERKLLTDLDGAAKLEMAMLLGALSMFVWMTTISIVQVWILRKLCRVTKVLTNHSGAAVKARLLSTDEDNTDVELSAKNGRCSAANVAAKTLRQSNAPGKRPAKASGDANPDTPYDLDD